MEEYMDANTAEMTRLALLPSLIFASVNKIQSPSKRFKELGGYIIEGLVLGLNSYTKEVPDVMTSLSKALQGGFSNIDPNVDIKPTITPVLDLSNVEQNSSLLGGLLSGGSSSIRLAASNASLFGSNANHRGQNDDVVSAIDKLGEGLHEDLSNMDSNVYNIKEITYNDENSITNAIKLIVRQVIREARA